MSLETATESAVISNDDGKEQLNSTAEIRKLEINELKILLPNKMVLS